MKAIFILSDSFRRDHLGAYGNPWIHTPCLDRLAQFATVFERAYVGSFPTGPNRRDLALSAGHARGHAFNPWINFADDEVTLAQRLSGQGVHTMMITDVANGATGGRNMFKGFQYYTVIRGQEGDAYWSDDSVPLEWEAAREVIRYPAAGYHRVLMNRSRRRTEDDYFAPRTFKIACEWLECNYKRDNFFLWIETFDPHEPWDPPPYYIDRYDPGYAGRVIEFPPYGFYRKIGLTDREVRHLRARYAGECTMVDHAVGRLLMTLEKLQLLDEVALFFTSDHGIYCGRPGDAGCVGKPWFVDEERGAWLIAGDHETTKRKFLPLRTGTMRIPLFLKVPGQTQGRRLRRITQPWDIAPTVLELFGRPVPPEFRGESLLAVLAGEKRPPRPYAFTGFIHSGTHLGQAMSDRWIYSCWTRAEEKPWLIDLKNDPSQTKNVATRNPAVCRRMHAALARFDPGGFESVENPWR